MSSQSLRRCFTLLVCVTPCSVLTTSALGAGSIVRVTNDGTQVRVLSDLIVYGDNDQKNTLLALNNAADDITMGPNDVRTFDAGFEVRRYFISMTTAQGSELEAHGFNIQTQEPRRLGYYNVTGTTTPLFPSIDYATAVDSLPAGTGVAFSGGTNAALPGWFMGTGADFNTGQVTGSYSGNGTVVLSDISVAMIPEPPVIGSATSCAAVCAAARRRRAKLQE